MKGCPDANKGCKQHLKGCPDVNNFFSTLSICFFGDSPSPPMGPCFSFSRKGLPLLWVGEGRAIPLTVRGSLGIHPRMSRLLLNSKAQLLCPDAPSQGVRSRDRFKRQGRSGQPWCSQDLDPCTLLSLQSVVTRGCGGYAWR